MAEECRSCRQEIDWATSVPPEGEVEKTNPINRDSADDPKGNLAIWRDESGILRYRYLRKGDQLRRGEHRGISHFATCPNRDNWRNRKPQQGGQG